MKFLIVSSVLMCFLFFENVIAEHGSSLVYPVLHECRPETLNFVQMMENQPNVFAVFNEVKDPLMSHRAIIGFIELSSPTLQIYELSNLFMDFAKDCYPLSSTTIDMRKGGGQFFLQQLQSLQDKAPDRRLYLEEWGTLMTL